jgi:hypothetical protein
MITVADLSEAIPDKLRPPLDRTEAPATMPAAQQPRTLWNVLSRAVRAKAPTALTPDQHFWRENGYLIKNRFMPNHLIDAYCRAYEKGGPWMYPTPYLDVPEMRDVCLYSPLRALLEQLIGEPMGLNLNLTGWFTSERNWHQDDYLNPPFVNGWYVAVWIALDDINPEVGPLEFVPGSHKWPVLRREKVLAYAEPDEEKDPAWPKTTERFVVPAVEQRIAEVGAPTMRFLGRKGDVLVWHAALVHRGSVAMQPGSVRKSLIAHYTGINHRLDMDYIPDGYFVPHGWSAAQAKSA